MKSNNKTHIKEIGSQVLPISSFFEVIGYFFAIASILYVITCSRIVSYDDLLIAFVVEGSVLLILMMISFFVVAILNFKKVSENEVFNNSQKCLDCIESKMEDGFHSHGLIHLDELIQFEGKLALSSNPAGCEVLVYTSDLATEKNAEKEVRENIKNGVHYIVLFFNNSCKETEFQSIKELYGEDNLVDLSKRDDYNTSFDAGLAKTLGFDIMIYKDCENSLKGYFAVDFVPEGNYRSFHDLHCNNMCNYGKENNNPFYKEISIEITKILYNEGIYIYEQKRII